MPFKDNLCFIHIPKCAGTSIEKAMKIQENHSHGFGKKRYHNRHSRYVFQLQHFTYNQLHSFHVLPKDRTFYYFTFVRNPYSRLVSDFKWCHRWLRHANIFEHLDSDKRGWSTFKDFVYFVKKHVEEYIDSDFLWSHFSPQYKFIEDCPIDYIGRVENFEKDLEHVSKESGVSLEVHHLNKRQHRPYQEFYTKELQDIVYELYKEDFERFGYSYELGK